MVDLLKCLIGNQLEVYYASSKVKANCSWEPGKIGTEQNILAKSMTAKYFLVDPWIESVISLRLDMGAVMCGTMQWSVPGHYAQFGWTSWLM